MIKKEIPKPVAISVIAVALLVFAAIMFFFNDSLTEMGLLGEKSFPKTVEYKDDYVSDYEELSTEELSSLKDATNQFAIDIYQELKEDENVFFSPYSIFTAFSMVYEGAEGDTAEQIREAFNFSEDDRLRRMGSRQLHKMLNREDTGYEMKVGNAMWMQEEYEILKSFTDTIKNYYLSEANLLNFIADPEGSREIINNWVAKKTKDLIDELLPEGTISTDTRLVLTNAIYFKGDWKDEFDEGLTRDENFYVTPEETVEVPMMQRTEERYDYYENDNVQALRLPYKGEELSMLVVLPKDKNISALENSLTVEKRNYWRENLFSTDVDVYLPKFKLDTNYSLVDVLSKMGIIDAFTEKVADFSGIEPRRELFISSVVHDAVISVDEKGTEAAAATGVVFDIESITMSKTFRADHPFLFFIEENETGYILFMGKVGRP